MALQPPQIKTEDPGAHELSESDDHFSSADEGTPHPNRSSSDAPSSPVPITRVERVDDQPAHGEVPGTPAYQQRTQDAVPDELEIVPDGQRSRSGTRSRAQSRPHTPADPPIPKTVVERVDDKPAHGEVDGTLAKEMRMADAEPDEVRRAPAEARDGQIHGRGDDHQVARDPEDQQAWFRSMWEGKSEDEPHVPDQQGQEGQIAEDDDFGDDFDEFAEGGGDDDDFGDFDEADDATPQPMAEPQPISQPAVPDILAELPPLNLHNLSLDETQEAIAPYISAIFPDAPSEPQQEQKPLDQSTTSPFLSDRSLSLWQQLVSPPPMQPPNWTRSRIRRLFLVSLGVPVDLDEILPPSKQKRLILPNISLSSTNSPRASTALDRLRDQAGANDSTTSLDSKTGGSRPSKKRPGAKGPPPAPDFDLNAAALLCSTTPEALSVYTPAELREHLETLEALNRKASGVLEYWLQRKDEGIKEKEALEGVIENLVGFVKGRRGK